MSWNRMLLPPLTIWICVSAAIRYGYYGDSPILLGPASSRLIKANSVFVKHVQVSNFNNDHQLILHLFNEKPQLNSTTNWTASNFFLVEPYQIKGIYLWLNKGSTIRIKWEAHTISYLNQLHAMVMKGENKFEQLHPKQTSFPDSISVLQTGNGKEAEYVVEEDDGYHIGVLNMNANNIIFTISINISAKVYDTTKANKICSSANGICRLNFLFPNTQYVVLTSTNNGDGGPYVEISNVARVLTYMFLLGLIVFVIYLIMKCLGVSGDGDQNITTIVDTYRANNIAATQTETVPLMRAGQSRLSYGTNAEDDEKSESEASSISSEELYDEKLCVICYDEQRNSFFVPCGHCATCYDCAKRIVDEEGKVCPICRRFVRKYEDYFIVRLFNL